MPNFLEESGNAKFPVALDTLGTFLIMRDSPLAISELASDLDTTAGVIAVEDCGVFDDGPSIVTIGGTEEICLYAAKSAANGPGNLTGVIRNWGNNKRRFEITNVDPTGNYFEVDGDQRAWFNTGSDPRITAWGGSGNNGEWTMVSSPTYIGGKTRIRVTEDIAAVSYGGYIIPASAGIGYAAGSGTKVYHLLGAEQLRLMSQAIVALEGRVGTTASIDPGSHEYRILMLEGASAGTIYSFGILGVAVDAGVVDGNVVSWDGTKCIKTDLSAGNIPIGTVREVTHTYPIVEADDAADYFKLAGDHRGEFPVGATFDVNNSTGNDGTWTVDSTSYDSGADETQINVVEDVTDGTDDGDITVAAWLLTLGGRDSGHAALTPGTAYYASAVTAGAISATESDFFIGVAFTTTDLLVSIRRAADWPRVIRAQSVNGSVVERSVVAFNPVSSEFVPADSNANNYPPAGVAINVSGGTADIVLEGPVAGFSSLTNGGIYFLSTTAGAITLTAPDKKTEHGWIVGVAHSTSTLWVGVKRHQHAAEVPVDNDAFTKITGTTVQDALDSIDDRFAGQTYSQISDTDPATNITGAELEQLSDGSDTTLHNHVTANRTRYLMFSTQRHVGGTDAGVALVQFCVPAGKTARVVAYGGSALTKRGGTISWDVGDPTLVTVTGGLGTTGLAVGDAFYCHANGTLDEDVAPFSVVTDVVNGTQFRVADGLGSSQTGYYWWTAPDNDASTNNLYWTAYKLTSSGRSSLISGQKADYQTASWTATAGQWFIFEVHCAVSDADLQWDAWVQMELY